MQISLKARLDRLTIFWQISGNYCIDTKLLEYLENSTF